MALPLNTQQGQSDPGTAVTATYTCADSSADTWVIVTKADAVGKTISRRKWKIKIQTSCFFMMLECCAMSVMQIEREAGLSSVTRLMAGDTFCSGKSFNTHRLWAFIQSCLYWICKTGTVTSLSHYPVLLSSLFGLEMICQCNADKQNKNVQFWMLSLLRR